MDSIGSTGKCSLEVHGGNLASALSCAPLLCAVLITLQGNRTKHPQTDTYKTVSQWAFLPNKLIISAICYSDGNLIVQG